MRAKITLFYLFQYLFIYLHYSRPAHFRMRFYMCGYLLQSTSRSLDRLSGKTKGKT